MELLHDPPSTSSYTSLSTHLSRTPSSFSPSAQPVLHHLSRNSTLRLHPSDLILAPIFSSLLPQDTQPPTVNGTYHPPVSSELPNGISSPSPPPPSTSAPETAIKGIDIWITSSKLILYSPTQNTGIAIPYPSISLHAIQRPNSVLLQLTAEERSGDRDDDGDEEGSVSLSVIPSAAGANTQEEDTEAEGEEGDEREEAQEIFEALSACAELHPDRDPMDEGGLGGGGGWGIFDGADEGGQGEGETGNGAYEQVSGQGLPPPMPGSGGWITAENMGEMLDEEGNLRGLGEGAGRVRDRGEAEEGEDGEREDEDGEGKWRRTE